MNKLITIETLEKQMKARGWIQEDAKIAFIEKDCIVTETYTGKRYSYRITNYIDGQQKYLCHKQSAIKKVEYSILKERIKLFDVFNIHYPDSEEGLIRFIFEVVFKVYGYSIRKEQIDLSIHMYQAMIEGNISLSDIPVGLGKTHAYLVAAIIEKKSDVEKNRSSRPVIITTSSIELQRAIVKEYLPEISEMLLVFGIIKRPIRSVIRKGKDNYLCETRLKSYIRNIDPKKKKIEEILFLREITEMEEIDLDEIKGLNQYDRKRINVNYNSCRICNRKSSCRYQQFMKYVKKSYIDIQVCNHNYFLADVIRRSKGLSALLPEHKVVVIDEAHKLIYATRQMYGTSIQQRELYSLAKRTIPKKIKGRESRCLKNLGEELMKYSALMFMELVNNIPENIDRDDIEMFETVLTSIVKLHINKVITNIEEIMQKVDNRDRQLYVDLRRAANELKAFYALDIIYWVEQPFLKGQCIFASIPVALNKEIGRDLWQSNSAKILTSGTLALNDDFEYIQNELGIETRYTSKIQQIRMSSPFDYWENCLLHIPRKLPYPNYEDTGYLEQIADKVEELIKASDGHAMVLFTSYKPLKMVYELLNGKLLEYDVILMSRGKKGCINEFKQTRNGVLFATGSAWEGMNIPGDLLSHLIIVKLPFPIPDPIGEYERMLYLTMEDYIEAVVVPQMLIKLRQGVGRLIRNENDSGVISILDSRATGDNRYHKAVVAALPECPYTTDLEIVKQFYKDKKHIDYFSNSRQ